MHVVRRLRARPERQLAVLIDGADRGMLLDRQVRVALEEEGVVEDLVGAGQRLVDVTELEVGPLVDVALFAVVVDAGLGMTQRLFRRGDRGQRPGRFGGGAAASSYWPSSNRV